jgi:hypothetical protein
MTPSGLLVWLRRRMRDPWLGVAAIASLLALLGIAFAAESRISVAAYIVEAFALVSGFGLLAAELTRSSASVPASSRHSGAQATPILLMDIDRELNNITKKKIAIFGPLHIILEAIELLPPRFEHVTVTISSDSFSRDYLREHTLIDPESVVRALTRIESLTLRVSHQVVAGCVIHTGDNAILFSLPQLSPNRRRLPAAWVGISSIADPALVQDFIFDLDRIWSESESLDPLRLRETLLDRMHAT